MISFQKRVEGVVYGTAYGDALGATVEKLTKEEIQEKYGRVTSIHVPWHKEKWEPERRLHRMRGYGIYTDDTLMTQALINVYHAVGRHVDAYDFADEFIKEMAFRPRYIPEMDKEAMIIERLFYPDKYPFVRHTLANCEPREGGIGNMVNCGAAMYIAPIGVVNACNPERAYSEAISFASAHQCSYGLEAAGVLAAVVAEAFSPDATIDSLMETALNFAKDGTRMAIEAVLQAAKEMKPEKEDSMKVAKAFHQALLPYSPMGDDVNRRIEKVGVPSNHYAPSRLHTIEELPIALGYIALHEGDFDPAILDGVNSGRDTDSIGVMVGVILGAFHGSDVFQERDIQTINEKNRIDLETVAREFTHTAEKIIQHDYEVWKKRTEQQQRLNVLEGVE